MLVSQTGSLKRSIPSAAGTASTGMETKTLCEPYPNARGYKGEAVCVEMNGFCSYGERRKSNENHT